jgi:hypothetical protein
MTTVLTRRHLLTAALAAGVAVPLGGAGRGWAAPTAPGPARLTLPAPTGPHPIGTVALHLVDRSRPVAGPGRHRELMASLWYPATRDARRYPVVPWMPAAPLRALLVSSGFDADVAAAPLTEGTWRRRWCTIPCRECRSSAGWRVAFDDATCSASGAWVSCAGAPAVSAAHAGGVRCYCCGPSGLPDALQVWAVGWVIVILVWWRACIDHRVGVVR